MARSTATKPATRKAQAKKANAPMKNTPKEKPARAAVVADAKKAARTMAKTVTPGIRKSAAKRVEKEEKRLAPMFQARQLNEAGFPAYKKQANRIMTILRNDAAAIAAGDGNEEEYRELVLALSRVLTNTKKKQGVVFE